MHALLPLTQTSSPLPGALKLEQFERSQQQKSPRIFSSTVDTRHSVLKTLLRNVSLLATCCSTSMAKGRDSSFDQCWRGLTGGTRSKAQKMKAELPYWICSQKQELEQVFIWSHLQTDTTAHLCWESKLLQRKFHTSPYQAMFSTLNGGVCGYAGLCKCGVTVWCAQRWACQGHFHRQRCILKSTGNREILKDSAQPAILGAARSIRVSHFDFALSWTVPEHLPAEHVNQQHHFCSWRSLLVYKEHFSWGLLKKKEEVEDFLCLPRSREGAANLNWTQQTFHVCWGISLVRTNLSGLYLQTKEMTQSKFCTRFVSPTETSSISLPSKHLILLFPSGNWKNVNCLLLSYVNKFELVPTGRGLDRHNSYRTVWQQLPRFSGNSCFFSGKLWPALLTARLQILIHTLIFISNVFWILCLACFNSVLIERNHTFFFISFHLSCIIRGTKCSERPAMSLLNSCILVFAVNRSSPIFLNKNEGFG